MTSIETHRLAFVASSKMLALCKLVDVSVCASQAAAKKPQPLWQQLGFQAKNIWKKKKSLHGHLNLYMSTSIYAQQYLNLYMGTSSCPWAPKSVHDTWAPQSMRCAAATPPKRTGYFRGERWNLEPKFFSLARRCIQTNTFSKNRTEQRNITKRFAWHQHTI